MLKIYECLFPHRAGEGLLGKKILQHQQAVATSTSVVSGTGDFISTGVVPSSGASKFLLGDPNH